MGRIVLLALSLTGARAQQPVAANLNQSVWKHAFSVTTAQLSDSAWLARDDDGDGIANGAEIAAATDPFSAASVLQVKRLTVDEAGLHFTFATIKGKQYVLQKKEGFAGGNWEEVSPAVAIPGTNAERTVTTAYVEETYFRVVVQDVDSDNDGLSDWAEINLGLDPLKAQSNNQLDEYGRPISDGEYAVASFGRENVVSVTAATASVEQPEAGKVARPSTAFTIVRGGMPGLLKAVTVQVTMGGTAVAGADYTALSSTVTLPAGIRSVAVPLVPLANSARTAPGSVTLSINTGDGYTLGSSSSAALLITPTSTPSGTGLQGTYYAGFSATDYSAATNFGSPLGTQVDPTVDFKWSNTAAVPAGSVKPPGLTAGVQGFCIRWTGQVQPQYSEKYWFTVKADDGVVLKINPTTISNQATGAGLGQQILNTWKARTSAAEFISVPVELKAGVKYNIQLDYFSNTTAGETRLSWYSDSQPKQIIPKARLYPSLAGTEAAPPVLTSESTLYGFVNQPFSSALLASNSPIGFAVQEGSLPAGLTLAADGVLSGLPTQAGQFSLTVRITNVTGFSDTALTFIILDTGNGITREIWKDLSADDLISSIPLTSKPDLTGTLPTLEDTNLNYGDNYGERLRGYITVNTTGNYYFWINGNDSAELWIANDDEPVSRVRRAATSQGGTTGRSWSLQPKQKSAWINLVAGRKYYLEVLHKGRSGAANHLAVGWTRDLTGYSAPIADGTGVVPGYVLWNYYAPNASSSAGAGALYYTTLGPPDGNISNGSGSATLRLTEDRLNAVLSYSYAGLTSDVLGKQIQCDAYLTHAAGQTLFDIDVAKPQADGTYLWKLAPVGLLTVADLQQIILRGKCYITVQTLNYPGGEIRGNFSLANGSQTFVPPADPPALPSSAPTMAEASRFLTQATFGPSPTDLAAVTAGGYRAWLENQFTLPSSKLSPLVVKQTHAGVPWPGALAFNAWWNRSVTAPDQLRQRIAFALSEILVVSENGALDSRADALADYYDLLLDGSFGNFRSLIKNVTLHPAMGIYLDMRANQKGDLALGRHPNENYAREIMQLFTIGLNRMWPDGSAVLDSTFNLVPTYDQEVINGLAQVFTGWDYSQARQGSGRLPLAFAATGVYRAPMVLVPSQHDLGEKRLLNNEVLPAPTPDYASSATTTVDPTYNENAYDSNGLRDLDAVVEALFHHPNTGPLICRQLIQRLVTSHPTPAYVYRVVRAFNGERNIDGVTTGVRGDLPETVRAILLDPEARTTPAVSETIFGKQREPVLRVTAASRYLAPAGDVTGTWSQSPGGNDPGRLTITLTGSSLPMTGGDRLLGDAVAGDRLNLQFGANSKGTITPTSSSLESPYYTVLSTNTTGSGATAVQTIVVDVLGQNRGTFTQTTTTATIKCKAHGLKKDGVVDLRFATVGDVPGEEGPFSVLSVVDPDTFTVARGVSTASTANSLVLIHRIPSCGMYVQGAKITIYTPVAHGLKVGDKVTIAANGKLDGSVTSTVATLVDKTTFTIANFADTDAVANQVSGGMIIFPQIPMELDRSGTLTLSTSTWQLGRTDSESSTWSLSQTPLRSPTVFNYFQPDYKAPGAIAAKGYTTPEFQLTSEANTVALTNFLALSLSGGVTASYSDGRASFREGTEAIMMNLSPLMTFAAANGFPALVDKLNLEMMGGLMSTGMRQAIVDYVIPANFATATRSSEMTRAVVHLIITSPEYAIQR